MFIHIVHNNSRNNRYYTFEYVNTYMLQQRYIYIFLRPQILKIELNDRVTVLIKYSIIHDDTIILLIYWFPNLQYHSLFQM